MKRLLKTAACVAAVAAVGVVLRAYAGWRPTDAEISGAIEDYLRS